MKKVIFIIPLIVLFTLCTNALVLSQNIDQDDPMVKYIRDNEMNKDSENISNPSNSLSNQFVEKDDDNTLPWSWSFFGGFNVKQAGTDKVGLTDPAFASVNSVDLNTRSDMGVVAGLKVGYTFKPIFRHKDTVDVKLALESEGFYSGFNYRGAGQPFTVPLGSVIVTDPSMPPAPIPAGTTFTDTLNAHVNSATFSFNPIIKVRVCSFQPYIGGGLGGTYLAFENISGTVNAITTGTGGTTTITPVSISSSKAHDFALTAQGIAGIDFLITKRISLFSEYKYVYLKDVNLSANGGNSSFDSFDQHILIGGFRINL